MAGEKEMLMVEWEKNGEQVRVLSMDTCLFDVPRELNLNSQRKLSRVDTYTVCHFIVAIHHCQPQEALLFKTNELCVLSRSFSLYIDTFD